MLWRKNKIMNTKSFNKNNVKVIAHRGLSGIEPENTASAFVAAGNRSYYGIETDIRYTLSGEFAVNHDGNLKRIAGEDLVIEESTYGELSSVLLFDKDGKKDRQDLRICTLENYLKICKRYEKHAVLELKNDFTEEQIARIAEIVNEYGYLGNITFISFIYDNLLKIRAILPGQSVQFLFSDPTDETVEKVIAAKIDVDVRATSLTPELVERFHAGGLTVNCWTVDDPEFAERLVEMGVDQITSNILE